MQHEYFGINALENLQEIFEREQAQRIFLVHGRTSFQASGAEEKMKGILKNYTFDTFLTSSREPQIEDVQKGIDAFRARNYDLVVALGGGSSLDIAKAIALLAEQEDHPEKYVRKELSPRTQRKPLIAIPTTSGSGSETTHFAVVYIEKTKYSLAHPSLLPEYAVVDPSLTFSLSPYVTAYTGMDALAQAIESYWCIHATAESQEFAREAITLALKHLENAVNSPTAEARIGMAKAANLAGKAINISKTTACHAISYPLTAHFGVPHGHAVALTLGEMFVYNAQAFLASAASEECLHPRGKAGLEKDITNLCLLFGSSTPERVRKKIQNLMTSIGLEQRLTSLGISSEEDRRRIISEVNMERGQNNPRRLTVEGLYGLLENIR